MEAEPNDARFSFSLSESLKGRLYAQARKLSTIRKAIQPAQLVREALERYLAALEAGQEDAGAKRVTEEGGKLSGLMAVARKIGRDLGLSEAQLFALAFEEHIEEYKARARERQERLRKHLEED